KSKSKSKSKNKNDDTDGGDSDSDSDSSNSDSASDASKNSDSASGSENASENESHNDADTKKQRQIKKKKVNKHKKKQKDNSNDNGTEHNNNNNNNNNNNDNNNSDNTNSNNNKNNNNNNNNNNNDKNNNKSVSDSNAKPAKGKRTHNNSGELGIHGQMMKGRGNFKYFEKLHHFKSHQTNAHENFAYPKSNKYQLKRRLDGDLDKGDAEAETANTQGARTVDTERGALAEAEVVDVGKIIFGEIKNAVQYLFDSSLVLCPFPFPILTWTFPKCKSNTLSIPCEFRYTYVTTNQFQQKKN
ncbi:hypothetical protein RFI_08918, partial [Reticulomyxa filosa]